MGGRMIMGIKLVSGGDGIRGKGRRWTDGRIKMIMSVVKRKHKLMRKQSNRVVHMIIR
jgi:hypothetical protein